LSRTDDVRRVEKSALFFYPKSGRRESDGWTDPGYQVKLVSDTSYGSLWEVSFVLKEF
jgi:hypothetical protein